VHVDPKGGNALTEVRFHFSAKPCD
jgi:hypothetical protein